MGDLPTQYASNQTPPQTLPGCIALVLAPLRLETDASSSCQHQLSQSCSHKNARHSSD